MSYPPPPPPQGPYGSYGSYGYGPPPHHKNATLALILGIISVAGTFICGIGALAGPFAWVIGKRAMDEIDASGGRLRGRGSAQAGYILGIIGTVLLALAILAVIVLVAVTASSSTS